MNYATSIAFELFFDQLTDLYRMEIQLCESMPRLVSLCTNEELRALVIRHADQNCHEILELAAIFDRHGEAPGEATSTALAGLIDSGTRQLEGVWSPHTRDLMMVAHCLRTEYFEMAAYEITVLLSGRAGLMREPTKLNALLAREREMAAALLRLEPELFETADVSTMESSPQKPSRGASRLPPLVGAGTRSGELSDN